MTLIQNNSEPLCPEQRPVHLLLELGHEGSVGREDDVLLLQLHRDEGLALTVVNEDVQAHAEKKNPYKWLGP